MPAFQTITPQRLDPHNRIWARKHIYCVFKTCTDARRHCKERRGRGFPSSTHHSQNNVKSCWTTQMRGEEVVLLASPAGSAQTGAGRQGKGSTQAAVWLSWAQPWGLKGAAKPRGGVGWMGKSCLGKQSFPRLAWGSEIRPFFWKGVILADSMGVIPVTNERLRKEGKGLTCILNLNTDIWHL